MSIIRLKEFSIALIVISAIVSTIVIAVVFAIIARGGQDGKAQTSWLNFYLRGKDAGYKLAEINLLYKAVSISQQTEPSNIFWSISAFTRCVRKIVLDQRGKGSENSPDSIQFLSDIFDLRTKVVLQQPQYTRGISSSTEIDKNQRISLTTLDGQSFNAQVIDSLRKYFAITTPEGLPPGTEGYKQRIRVQFWRANDATYSFNTEIIDSFDTEGILHIRHSSKIKRVQLRSSIRVGIQQAAKFSVINTNSNGDEAPSLAIREYRCRLINISESGVGILVGGRARAGMLLRIFLELQNEAVTLTGSVKNVNYNSAKAVSILNVQSKAVNLKMKNIIHMFVYGIFSEET